MRTDKLISHAKPQSTLRFFNAYKGSRIVVLSWRTGVRFDTRVSKIQVNANAWLTEKFNNEDFGILIDS